MAIQTLHDTGTDYTVLSKMDGGVYSIGVPDCVIEGIGDEFTINYSSDSLNVTFNAGSEAVIGGSFFKINSLESVTLVPNSTIYLCANIDLSRPNGQTGAFAMRTATNMQSDNLNGSGTSRDLLLYVIQTGTNGVTSVSDRRPIKDNVIDDLISSLSTVARTGSYNDLTNKPTIGSGTLTIQRNGSNVTTFSANATGNATANITVPTNTSQLTNNSGFNTKHGVDVSRVLVNYYQYGGSVNWTASEDGLVFYFDAGAYTYLYIDNVAYTGSSDGNFESMHSFPIKAGTNLKAAAAGENWACRLKVYGMK